ncbi:alkaline shock response membrane anchor protein AmaP [Arthrobacter sp. ZGTC412]|uniref:alkaline shock response membrane anchor protein AmaP n=1 Tax=Arthrobacter sp. ZGTC412 TaxID=2058900 RepID=UPI000CE4AC3F|nr:alkaline shock response membrane anchor protein AmaP [Arthrobacter sp. ZGTC412]
MKQTAGTLNRTWLTVLGILLLAAGIALLLQAAGVLPTRANTAPAGDKVVPGDLYPYFGVSWVVVLLMVIGLIVGVLGLMWLIAQIPRKNTADTYRLSDGAQGRTTCDPSVLAKAVENQVNNLPGVVTSSALLRGTATEPNLTLKVTVTDTADVQDLLRQLETSTLPNLSTALESPLQESRLQIDVSSRNQNTGTVVRSTGTVIQ